MCLTAVSRPWSASCQNERIRNWRVYAQIIAAADKLGEAEMQAQFTAALGTLQRDIMFANSLYL
jgi:hypothetical protein